MISAKNNNYFLEKCKFFYTTYEDTSPNPLKIGGRLLPIRHRSFDGLWASHTFNLHRRTAPCFLIYYIIILQCLLQHKLVVPFISIEILDSPRHLLRHV